MSAGRRSVTNKKDWNTPPKFAAAIKDFLGEIELDPCSNSFSIISAKTTFVLPMDGLAQSWNYSTIFVNPPYGRDAERKTNIYSWVKKGADANLTYGSEVLFLIPVATNTKHFKEIIFKYACGICFLFDTRLKFWSEGHENKKGAPMSCCFVYFGKKYKAFEKVFSKFGKCLAVNA